MCTNCSIDNDKDTLYPESSDHVYMLVRGKEVKYSLETFKVWELWSFDIFTTTTLLAQQPPAVINKILNLKRWI